jgi:6-phosphogluconolactonase
MTLGSRDTADQDRRTPKTLLIRAADGVLAEAAVYPDEPRLVAGAADLIAAHAADAVADQGRFSIALSGGNTPRPVYERLAKAGLDWTRVHLFFGDERCVPPEDSRSNYHMAKAALIDRIPIPPANVHRMRGEDIPEAAAEAYADELVGALGPDGRLDLVLLGLGDNGHTASLFPGLAAVAETKRTVLAAYVEVVGMWRLTLTPPPINAAGRVVFLAAGDGLAEILHRVLYGRL